MLKKIGIVGGGVVGKAMYKLCGNNAIIYDPYLRDNITTPSEINLCDIAFICVPTPMKEDGDCDVSIVEQCVSWIECPLIVIRSTIEPGTTDRLKKIHNKRIVFQPEYLGETTSHVFVDMGSRPFAVLGGDTSDTSAVADFYKQYYNSYMSFFFCDALTAELCKYMENAFFAVKVTFVNEFYDIARAHGVDFNLLREMWLADVRVSRDHTFVYPDNRGFSGKCLPKDCNAIVKSSEKRGYSPKFMKYCLEVNDIFRSNNPSRTPPTRGGDCSSH